MSTLQINLPQLANNPAARNINFSPDKLGSLLAGWWESDKLLQTASRPTPTTTVATNLGGLGPTAGQNISQYNISYAPTVTANALGTLPGISNPATSAADSNFVCLKSPSNIPALNFDYNTPFTICGAAIWRNTDNLAGIVGVWDNPGSTGKGWLLNHFAGTLSFWLVGDYSNNYRWLVKSSVTLTDGQLYTYQISYDGSGAANAGTFSITINGAVDGGVSFNVANGVDAGHSAISTGSFSVPCSAFNSVNQDEFLGFYAATAKLTGAVAAGSLGYLARRWHT